MTRKEKAFHRTWKWAKKGEKLETKSLHNCDYPKRKSKKRDNVMCVKYENKGRNIVCECVDCDMNRINYGNRERTRKKNVRQRRKNVNSADHE